MLTEGRKSISPDDLRISAIGMQRHMALLAPKPAEKSAAEVFADSFTKLVTGAIEGFAQGDEDGATKGDLVNARDRIMRRVDENLNVAIRTKDIASAGAEAAKKGRDYGRKTHELATEVHEKVCD